MDDREELRKFLSQPGPGQIFMLGPKMIASSFAWERRDKSLTLLAYLRQIEASTFSAMRATGDFFPMVYMWSKDEVFQMAISKDGANPIEGAVFMIRALKQLGQLGSVVAVGGCFTGNAFNADLSPRAGLLLDVAELGRVVLVSFGVSQDKMLLVITELKRGPGKEIALGKVEVNDLDKAAALGATVQPLSTLVGAMAEFAPWQPEDWRGDGRR